MNKAFYFPGLNGLRFLAAFVVIIHHIEQLKMIAKMDNYWHLPFIKNMGGLGVTFFFTLSGFLITYLLILEKKENRKVDVKNFYIRRILRIWPLYFIIVFISFAVLPQFLFSNIGLGSNGVTFNNLVLFTFMLANAALIANPPVFGAAQLWSVSSEEHFYLIYPHVFNKFSITPKILIKGVLLFNCIKIFFYFLLTKYQMTFFGYFYDYFNYFRIDCMLLGGIGACWYYNNARILKIIYTSIFYRMVLLSLFLLCFYGVQFGEFTQLIYTILFIILILNVSTGAKKPYLLENKIMNFLGKISYGLYIYHGLIIGSILLICNFYSLILNDFILYPIVILVSIIISSVSYLLIEKPFLKLKSKKYSVIAT